MATTSVEGLLWSSPTCPFAHRTRALLHRLNVPHVRRDTSLIWKDREFLAVSPTGKVPLWLEGDLVLPESAAIGAHLAEIYRWSGAWPGSPALQERQREAMRQFDQDVLPIAYYRALRWFPLGPLLGGSVQVERTLDTLQSLVQQVPPDSMMGLHLGPFWQRFLRMAWLLGVVRRIRTDVHLEDCRRGWRGRRPRGGRTTPADRRARELGTPSRPWASACLGLR